MAARKQNARLSAGQAKRISKLASNAVALKEITSSQETTLKSEDFSPQTSFPFSITKKTALILGALVLLGIIFYKKDLFVAATVNGTPVSTIELFGRMNQEHRSQTLDQLISEKLLLSEASNKGMKVNQEEVNKKISDLEGQFGGKENFDGLLAEQGQSRSTLDEQVRLQLIVEKLYLNEATVSSNEVDTFIKESTDFLQSTDAAEQRKEAEGVLKQQKLSQIFTERFQELKRTAKIQIF